MMLMTKHQIMMHQIIKQGKPKKTSKKKEKEVCSFEENFEGITTKQVIDCSLSEESTSESDFFFFFLDIVTDTESDSTESEG